MNQSDLTYLNDRLDQIVRAAVGEFDRANPKAKRPDFKQRYAAIKAGRAKLDLKAVESARGGYTDDWTTLFTVPGDAEAKRMNDRIAKERERLIAKIDAEKQHILDEVKLGQAVDALTQLRAFDAKWSKYAPPVVPRESA